MLSFEFLLRLSAILKLDFLKTPGKSGSARPPRGMKLGNGQARTLIAKYQFVCCWSLLVRFSPRAKGNMSFR